MQNNKLKSTQTRNENMKPKTTNNKIVYAHFKLKLEPQSKSKLKPQQIKMNKVNCAKTNISSNSPNKLRVNDHDNIFSKENLCV